MPPLLMKLLSRSPGGMGAYDGMLVPGARKPSALPDPLLVAATIGAPVESLRTLGSPVVPTYVGQYAQKVNGKSFLFRAAGAPAGSAGVSVGDFMLVAIAMGGGFGQMQTPVGWTLADSNGNFFVWTRTRAAGDPDAYEWLWSLAQQGTGLLIAYRGVESIAKEAQKTESGSTNRTSPSFDVNVPNLGLLLLVMNTVWNCTPASGWTERYDDGNPGGAYIEAQDLLASNDPGTKGPYAFTSGGSQAGVYFMMALAPASQAGVGEVPIESLQGIKQSSNANIEPAGSAQQTGPFPLESLGGIAKTAGDPIESLQNLAITGNVATEWLSLVSAAGSSSYEWLQGIRQTTGEPFESLGGLAALGSDPMEFLKGLAQTAGEPIEWLQAVQKIGAGSPFESLGGVRQIGSSSPWESLGGVSKTVSAPLEWLALLAASGVLPWESLQAIRQSAAAPHESLAGVRALVSAPFELLGALSATLGLSIESLHGLAAPSGGFPWESTQNFLLSIHQTAGLPLEWKGPVRKTAGLPLDVRTLTPGARLILSEITPRLMMTEFAIREYAVSFTTAAGVVVEFIVEGEHTGTITMSESPKHILTLSESGPIA